MIDSVQAIDLTRHDLDLIEAALHTQEKILTIQSRAGGNAARLQLNDLKGLMRRLCRQVPNENTPVQKSWGQMARSIFV
ncbi:MAG: hypothetical protein ABJ034_03585 [Hyphomicrobiales bacterium]